MVKALITLHLRIFILSKSDKNKLKIYAIFTIVLFKNQKKFNTIIYAFVNKKDKEVKS
jgi:hypothetical protein